MMVVVLQGFYCKSYMLYFPMNNTSRMKDIESDCELGEIEDSNFGYVGVLQCN